MEEEGATTLGAPSFGTLLRRYRLAAGLSQEALAERARVSVNGISALERGERRSPQRETLALLGDALALSAEQQEAFRTAAARPRMPRTDNTKGSVTTGPWPDSPSSTLPIPITSFIGREIELDEVTALVRLHRLVTLTGTGGIGKTRTANEVAAMLSPSVDVRLVELAAISDASQVTTAIAAALGLQEVPGRPLLETFLSYLKNANVLLLLDNCEHIIAETARIVEALLRGCSGLRILATSREPLRVTGEHVYRLPSLESPRELGPRITLAEASRYASITLFRERAQAVDRNFALSDENVAVVADICRRLDGIPLAIELAAARVTVLSVKALADKLDQRFALLSSGGRTTLPRQQTMRATIDWSYDLLSPSEQRMFERLSVFAGGCTLEAATAVCAEDGRPESNVLRILSSLVDKSLVIADVTAPQPRYRLLESSREYGREKLAGRDELASTVQRHALVYLELAERLEEAYDSAPDDQWYGPVRVEFENWRSVLEWALGGRNQIELGQRLAGAMAQVWHNFSPAEGRRWVRLGLELLNEHTPSDVIAHLEYADATASAGLGEGAFALDAAQRALVRYQQLGDDLGIARAHWLAGQSLAYVRRPAEGAPLLQDALKTARRLRRTRFVAFVLVNIGHALIGNDDQTPARIAYAEALATFKTLGSGRCPPRPMHDFAEAEAWAGNPLVAVEIAEEGLRASRALNDVYLVSIYLVNLTMYLVTLGRYDEARSRGREALDLGSRLHIDLFINVALQHLAAAAAFASKDDADRAPEDCRRAARLLGYVDAQFAATHEKRHHTDHEEYIRLLSFLTDCVPADQLTALIAAGGAMVQDEAIDEAMRI